MLTIYTSYPPRGGNLVYRYKAIDNFTKSIKLTPPPPPPKCAKMCHNRCFRFLLGDCIKRRKKLETMVIKNWVGGVGGGGRGEGVNKVDNYMVSLKMVNKV